MQIHILRSGQQSIYNYTNSESNEFENGVLRLPSHCWIVGLASESLPSKTYAYNSNTVADMGYCTNMQLAANNKSAEQKAPAAVGTHQR